MERRDVVAAVILVVALAALVAGGLYVAAAPAPNAPDPSQQAADFLASEGPRESTVLPGGVPVAMRALAPGGMSGDFARTRFA
jgi:hypothetical protein